VSGVDAGPSPAGGSATGPRAGWPRAALLSLSDKSGAAGFAGALAAGGTRLVASGGTARHLEQAGLAVTPVERWTGFPEMLGGRVKTLHPHVHGAILARRDVAGDLETLAARGVVPIDLVAVTLYPFEERAGALDEAGAVEEIDIGGVALLRAAAKNFAAVIVVHDPARYSEVLAELAAGGPSPEVRRRWAAETFARTARYDAAIAGDLARRAGGESPPLLVTALERVRGLRYGENPHQRAALYAPAGLRASLHAEREGRELSYNNLLDVEAAVSLAARFVSPACVIVKHNQPCGAACADDAAAACALALGSDEQSAFGGIVAVNRPLDRAAVEALGATFFECIAAPQFTPEAEDRLKSRRNLRLLRLSGQDLAAPGEWSLRAVGPWWLAQREGGEPEPGWRPATRREPTADEMASLRFAWEVVAAARSNAIAIARGRQLVGLGSGQTSRVDAVDVAVLKARRAGHDLAGAALASDAFFPFADNVEHAAAAGVTAIVQPGGSVRDAEVIAACDRAGIAMMFTGRRVFRH
jgi:phosphoribosylaminoimidazolecarboxamide formyltransferase/IMP cyclohydrolase